MCLLLVESRLRFAFLSPSRGTRWLRVDDRRGHTVLNPQAKPLPSLWEAAIDVNVNYKPLLFA